MLFSSALAVFLISWSSLFLLDYVLRLKNVSSYVEFALRHGLEVSPFQFRLYTSRSNAAALLPERKGSPSSVGQVICRSLYSIWFGIGALVSMLCLFGITFYLARLLYTDVAKMAARRPHVAPYRAAPTVSSSPTIDDLPPPPNMDYDVLEGGQRNTDGLVPIVPGVNLPWNHIPVFMFVLIFAAVIHELGHSMAASARNVKVNGFGIFIFAIYPGAFTDIDPESLKRATPVSKLMIFGGGIWHNLVLAGLAYLLFIGSPTLLSPLYTEGAGVTVVAVDSRSGLYGSAGLSPGYIVDYIDSCAVRHVSDWRDCVRLLEHQENGRCVSSSLVDATRNDKVMVNEDEIHCCDGFSNITHAHMCFEATVLVVSRHRATRAPSLNGLLKIGAAQNSNEVVQESKEWTRQFSCMSARQVTDQPSCNVSSICEQSDPDDPTICVFPALYNGTQLLRISVRDHHRPVLYVGNLDELISFVVVHPLVPRWNWVPYWWADTAQLIPKYFFTLSIALGVLNAVPCYALDGQYIVITLVNWFLRFLPKRRRQSIISMVLFLGTSLLATNILIGLFKFLF